MPSITLNTALGLALEKALNKALSLDSFTRDALLQQFDNKSIALHCTRPEISLRLHIGAPMQVSILDNHNAADNECDVSVSGEYPHWLTLARADDKAAALINSELNISGDSKLLIAVSNVLERIDIDWEAPLAKRLGDVPAHGIGQAIRRSHKLVKQKLQRAGGVFSEFVREEARLSPSKDEAEAFYQSLRQTEMQIDRLEAKLRQRSH